MKDPYLTVIDMFSAPACVIRQYADNILYAVKISLTTGKRSGKGLNRPYTDKIGERRKNSNETGRFWHSSVV